ncbi:MAG TPA: VIT family protein [Caulobacteraceae bacterium]
MKRPRRRSEWHYVGRTGWLRAAVLGANDGILSTGSLILGVAAAAVNRHNLVVTGLAGLVAGAMSMAAGEYVSVSSQADSEQADLARERLELDENIDAECRELAAIYVHRGLDGDLAEKVAHQLMAKDALGAHARDELGISDTTKPRPVQAAMASAASFSAGAAAPVIVAAIAPATLVAQSVAVTSLAVLGILGAVGARAGGAPAGRATVRVVFWGVLAMAVTYAIGALVGHAV